MAWEKTCFTFSINLRASGHSVSRAVVGAARALLRIRFQTDVIMAE
jgi:hypothetical protein